MSAGVTTLPFDFDIFLRSGSTMKPESAACVHGATPFSSCERSMVENSQVRMMSWPCGRRSNGKTASKSSSSRFQPPASCGVSDEVIQVSITSCSPTKPPGWLRWLSSKPGAASDDGSTGSCRRVGRIGSSKTRVAVAVERVPDRDGHAEEALARDQPVAGEAADPVLVAHAHELGVPVELAGRARSAARAAPRRGRRS